jgi:thymidylate kinase
VKRLIILEGPDGGGKTTLGAKLSQHLGVDVTNHGPYKGEAQIWKHYFDSMLPAYAEQCDVILDRCWLAEPIYGRVFRGGLNRLEFWQTRILEHVAASCKTTVLYCLPGVEACMRTFNKRRELEMLSNDAQLRDVYYGYLDQAAEPCKFGRALVYNYRTDKYEEVLDVIAR